MVPRGVLYGLALLGCGALVWWAAQRAPGGSAASPLATQPSCTASGAKYLTPPLSDPAACARLLAGLSAVPGLVRVELSILPQGTLSALVATSGMPPKDFGQAVMDRAMTPADLDRLAESAVAGLRPNGSR